jgi:hypothetical protein
MTRANRTNPPADRSPQNQRARKSALKSRIDTEGAEAAFDALLRVCRDPKASAQALASAGGAIFRAAGLFEKDEGGGTKEPHEMSPQEIQERIDWLRSRHSIGFADGEDGDPNGVFG